MFRKGTALLGPEEMEGEYAGEELRKEVCVSPHAAAHATTLTWMRFPSRTAPRSDGGTTTPTAVN